MYLASKRGHACRCGNDTFSANHEYAPYLTCLLCSNFHPSPGAENLEVLVAVSPDNLDEVENDMDMATRLAKKWHTVISKPSAHISIHGQRYSPFTHKGESCFIRNLAGFYSYDVAFKRNGEYCRYQVSV